MRHENRGARARPAHAPAGVSSCGHRRDACDRSLGNGASAAARRGVPRGEWKGASRAQDVRELRRRVRAELPPALRSLWGAVREHPSYGPAVHGGLRAVHAVALCDHVRARPLEAAPTGPCGHLYGVSVRFRPFVRGALHRARHPHAGHIPSCVRYRASSGVGVRVRLHAARHALAQAFE